MPPLGNKIKKILKSATYGVTDLRNTAGKYQSKTQIYQVKGYRCALKQLKQEASGLRRSVRNNIYNTKTVNVWSIHGFCMLN